MEIRVIQSALNAKGANPPITVDGVAGRKTLAALDLFLASHGADPSDWSDARRLIAAEQSIYHDAGIEVGVIDGLVGEQTRYARDVFAARARGDKSVETWRDEDAKKPAPAGPPRAQEWPRQADVPTFFGAPGSNHATFNFPFPMRLAWEPTTNVFRTAVNAKVHAPISRIWTKTLAHYGAEKIKQLRLDMFGGCYNDRNMRGGTKKSMHAFAIAWDIDPDRNQLKWGRDLATLDGSEYEPFWKLVEAEGAVSLGRLKNFDWMHFQFARL